MKHDDIVLRWPTLAQLRQWMRSILGVRPGPDEARALAESQARRYDDVSRCC